MLKAGEFFPAVSVANWFVNRVDRASGEAITHLKLQKLVYYSQAWFLANYDRPLFTEEMQAWTHGPVAPSVYEKYRGQGWDALPSEKPQKVPAGLADFFEVIYKKYGQFGAKKLEEMTHDEIPWALTRGDIPLEARCTKPIDKLLIRNFYAKRIGKKEIKKIRD